MTEKERMHLVDQIGECMNDAEVEQVKRTPEVLIDVKSPGNRIALGDYIEINIFLSSRAQGDAGAAAGPDAPVPARE